MTDSVKIRIVYLLIFSRTYTFSSDLVYSGEQYIIDGSSE
jgi:hypothetical protein